MSDNIEISPCGVVYQHPSVDCAISFRRSFYAKDKVSGSYFRIIDVHDHGVWHGGL